MGLINRFINRKHIRKYGHIISLGYNCELSYQLFKHNKFVESNLFGWTYIYSAQDMLNALDNIDLIGEDGFLEPNPLFECKNTHIRFHGNDRNPTKKDYEELSNRVKYLKEKFIKTLSDGENNLYIIKIRSSEPNIEQIIKKSYEKLSAIVSNEFDLLVVLESKVVLKEAFEDFPNLFIKKVEYFSPDDDVTTKKCDKKHWEAIFDLFLPKYKLKKRKKFKFEVIDE